jgi:hypothetical protein
MRARLYMFCWLQPYTIRLNPTQGTWIIYIVNTVCTYGCVFNKNQCYFGFCPIVLISSFYWIYWLKEGVVL